MKKVSILVLTMLLVLSLLPLGYSAIQAKGAVKPVKLNLWTYMDLHKKYYEKTAELWNKSNPKQPIDLTVDVYPNAEMHNKLLIALQSGVGAPDISDININFFQNFLKGDIPLVSLNRVINPVKSKCIQSRFDIYSKNGQYYGICFHVGATVVYYNKDLMNQAGVDVDKIVTWNDYVNAGKKVLAVTGKPMTAVEVTDQRPFWPMIVQRGSDYLDKKGNVTMDSETNVKTLQFIKDMIYKEKIAIPMPGGNTNSEEFFAFMNKGGIASLIMPMWYMSRFTSYMPDLKGKIMVRPMPIFEKGNSRSAGIGGTGTAVTKQSKNQNLAVKFLAYAKLSKESNIRIWQELNFDPIRWDVWDSPELAQPLPYFNNEKVFKVLLTMRKEIRSPNMGELSAAAQDIVKSNVMFKSLKDQSQTPEQALKAAAEELRRQRK
ncbi:arabinosaccharide transport system substrate-binding protein [Hydrogenispora ethanolica]|uniref:Arabinosaccharide transport system substrate-binding protein n=1 Tax=Hydrogenispora ethanolica TaxID=1082276 RepID=A0A4R1S4D0_HYDET|nr:extracellular solute-binding protein [Hydrogenispora ethanolica]TCL74121.1 arabinosaccharide transport system substrate-binding protein [Hydrogenispora ethanolica]